MLVELDRRQRRPACDTVRLALAAGAVFLAAACGDARDADGGPGAGSLATAVDTTGAWVRVANSGGPPEWGLVLVASIGPGAEADAEGPGDFGAAASVAFGPDDREVYVVDRLSCEIRVFGLDGIHRRTFGRCGEGPGEFTQYLHSIAWVGDRLLAFDLAGGRIGELAADGEWLGQRRVEAISRGSSYTALYRTGPNEAYARTLVTRPREGARLGDVFLGHDAGGATADTVWRLASPPGAGLLCTREDEGSTFIDFFENPYAPWLLQHPGPGGTLWSAMTSEYRVVVSRGADTLRVIERDLTSEPVADEEWDALSRQFETWLADRPGVACEPRRPERPAGRPLMEALFLDAAGRLWVEVARTSGRRWELFDAEGRLLAQLPSGDRKRHFLPGFGVRHLATIREDGLGRDHVDVWRIEEPAR